MRQEAGAAAFPAASFGPGYAAEGRGPSARSLCAHDAAPTLPAWRRGACRGRQANLAFVKRFFMSPGRPFATNSVPRGANMDNSGIRRWTWRQNARSSLPIHSQRHPSGLACTSQEDCPASGGQRYDRIGKRSYSSRARPSAPPASPAAHLPGRGYRQPRPLGFGAGQSCWQATINR